VAVGRAEVVDTRGQSVLGKGTLQDRDLALAAGLATAANSLDLDAEGPRGIQQDRAGRYVALAPGRLKNNTEGLIAR